MSIHSWSPYACGWNCWIHKPEKYPKLQGPAFYFSLFPKPSESVTYRSICLIFWIRLLIFGLPFHQVVKKKKWDIKTVELKLLDPCALLQTLLPAPSLPGWCFLGHTLQVTQKNQTGSASCPILPFVLRAPRPRRGWVQAALSSPTPWGAVLDPGGSLGDWGWRGALGNGLETEAALRLG